MKVDTFTFNMIVIWLMSALFYVALYFEVFRRMLKSLGSINRMLQK
jgi:hypothetical protein